MEIAPDEPRLASLNSNNVLQTISPALLDARQLAGQGDTSGALAVYRSLFNGCQPPDSLANEYYLIIAGDRSLLPQAAQALEQRTNLQPEDAQTRLALGKVLTHQEATRRDGITILSAMADANPDADRLWRQALLWMAAQEGDSSLYQDYQARHPTDTGVMEYFRKNVGGDAKGEGFSTAEQR